MLNMPRADDCGKANKLCAIFKEVVVKE